MLSCFAADKEPPSAGDVRLRYRQVQHCRRPLLHLQRKGLMVVLSPSLFRVNEDWINISKEKSEWLEMQVIGDQDFRREPKNVSSFQLQFFHLSEKSGKVLWNCFFFFFKNSKKAIEKIFSSLEKRKFRFRPSAGFLTFQPLHVLPDTFVSFAFSTRCNHYSFC